MERLINFIFLITINSVVVLSYNIELFDSIHDNIPFTGAKEKLTTDSFDDVKEKCDLDSHCAGVSTYFNESSEETYAMSYSFLPNELLHDDDDTEIDTYQSSKPFTLHRGRVRKGTILSYGHERMTADEAKHYCDRHPYCVAFFYPVHSLDLTAPDNITFMSAMNEFDHAQEKMEHDWYTFISNDQDKAKYVNESSLEFYIDLVENPFPRCCTESKLPTIEEIEAVDTLERISCDISREEFLEKYEMERRPVMLVGCDKEWKGLERWTFENLIPRFDNDTKWRARLTNDDLNEAVPWKTIVDRMTSNEHFYIFDPLDREHQKVLYEDYSTPYPLKGADLFEGPKRNGFPDKEYGSMRWWCVSNGNSGTFPHNDPISTDAWNSLVTGHKWWIIFPESVGEFDPNGEESLTCSNSCSMKDYSPRDWYASIGVNAANFEYPGNDGQRPLHIVQKPGETIYVPNGRIHAVYNLDPNIAITANFGSIGNFDKVWEEIVTSDNPQHWQQVYYQDFDENLRELARETSFWPASEYAQKHDVE